MPRKAQDSTTSKSLVRHLEKGATGRLWVAEGPIEVSVHVQEGNLLAAEASDDAHHYLRRLGVENAIPAERLTELERAVEAGDGVFGAIVDEARPELLDKILTDRFYDNVARFMGSDQKPQFEFTAGIFVDNLQMGLDPKNVLFDAGSMWDAASTVDLDVELIRGAERPRLAKEVKVIHALGEASVLVGTLLPKLSYEPIAARALIAAMLSSRVLALKPREVPVEDDVATGWDDDLGDEDTEMVEREEAPAAGPALHVEPDAPSLRSNTQDRDDEDSEVIQRVGAVAVVEEVDEQAPLANLRTAQDWLGHGVEHDDDLDAFSDHDDEVRGGGAGTFSTEQHNLDRVEVGDVRADEPPPLAEEEEVLEAEELPQARYGAPTLTDDVALEKIAVAQEVLARIGQTFDEEKGAGAGRAALQLLIEGSPGRYAHLLTEVNVGEDNHISPSHVLRNLAQRPMAEHRKLLNEGLVDLIERALSMGADELSDEAVDDMLEQVAGYRQRIGF